MNDDICELIVDFVLKTQVNSLNKLKHFTFYYPSSVIDWINSNKQLWIDQMREDSGEKVIKDRILKNKKTTEKIFAKLIKSLNMSNLIIPHS